MADYTQLSFEEIIDLISPYDLGAVYSAAPMKGGQANSSFELFTASGQFILSVCDEKDAQEVEYLTRVLDHLETEKFPTSRVVKTKGQDRFIMLDGKPVYVKNYIKGQVVKTLNSPKLNDLGRVLAKLHTIAPIKNMHKDFPYGLGFIKNLCSSDIQHNYIDWLRQKSGFIKQELDPEMTKGMIHGDIFWDNLLFSGDQLVAVIDFEEACFYFTLFDLGMSALGCCGKNGSFDRQKVGALLKGYQQSKVFNIHEKKQLKIFMEYAAVAASSWRYHQYNVKYPDHSLAMSYQELTSMADHVHEMDDKTFMQIF